MLISNTVLQKKNMNMKPHRAILKYFDLLYSNPAPRFFFNQPIMLESFRLFH